jgi:hypothetical protein
MKLSPLQILWMAGAIALSAALMLDVANVISPPNLLWPTFAGLLLLTSRVMPSAGELRRFNRRG